MKSKKTIGISKKARDYSKTETEILKPVGEAQAAYASQGMQNVVDFMGMTGRKHFSDMDNDADFIEIIRRGVPKKILDHLMVRTGITPDEMARILHISDRTLRRYNPQTILNQEQSERLIELAKLYSRGEHVFGTMEHFKSWMNNHVLTLGSKKPKEFLDTSIGISLLLDELGRIEYGIYS